MDSKKLIDFGCNSHYYNFSFGINNLVVKMNIIQIANNLEKCLMDKTIEIYLEHYGDSYVIKMGNMPYKSPYDKVNNKFEHLYMCDFSKHIYTDNERRTKLDKIIRVLSCYLHDDDLRFVYVKMKEFLDKYMEIGTTPIFLHRKYHEKY